MKMKQQQRDTIQIPRLNVKYVEMYFAGAPNSLMKLSFDANGM